MTHRPVPVSWHELLTLPDRKLRRVLADRYRADVLAARGEARAPRTLPPVVRRALAVEVERLEASAARIYEEMAVEYAARARASAAERTEPAPPAVGPRVAPLDEFADLVQLGESPDVAIERTGTTRTALERAAYRRGRRDVLAMLGITAQEPHRELAVAS